MAGPQTKVATCCHCGTRAALVLAGTVRHELACASCGAPLHDLKMFPVKPDRPPVAMQPATLRRFPGSSVKPENKRPKTKIKKKKKSFKRKLWSEAWDLVEDIFD